MKKRSLPLFIFVFIFVFAPVNPLLSSFSLAHDGPDNQQHYKPGANIQLQHDYDGMSAPGEPEEINLILSGHSLSDGEYIKIHLNPPHALKLKQASTIETQVVDHQISVPITITALEAGRHYLGIHAEVTDHNGHHDFRVFEMPIQVGERLEKPLRVQKTDGSSGGRKVIVLESSEIVHRPKKTDIKKAAD